MTNFDDQPIVSIEDVYRWMLTMFAAIGMMAVAGIIGLYVGGFWHYVASKYPDGWLAVLLGVTL